MDIDQEWENFISSENNYDDSTSDDDCDIENNSVYNESNEEFVSSNILIDLNSQAPKATNIYISTKTKISYLNTVIDLKSIFWDIPVIDYSNPTNGVIKKQMKFNSLDQNELNFIKSQIANEKYVEEHVISHIDNPSGRIKFKDIRKISIGISKKDIMSYRCKKKSAFYNCFVIILRIKISDTFKEFHIKVFNTGKLEIPGIQSEDNFKIVLSELLVTLQPYFKNKLGYKENTDETVLINSNFNCGFFINRESLYDILKYKYNIQSIYDPCSYPGIQCKFYYNPDVDIQNGCQIAEENKHLYKDVKEVSFMIFRTGSVLIVGKCDENVLLIIYEYLKIILNNEHKNICQKYTTEEKESKQLAASKEKVKKIRRKNIIVEFKN